MKKTKLQLIDERNQKEIRMKEILDNAQKENRELTKEEEAEFDKTEEERDALEEEISKADEADELRSEEENVNEDEERSEDEEKDKEECSEDEDKEDTEEVSEDEEKEKKGKRSLTRKFKEYNKEKRSINTNMKKKFNLFGAIKSVVEGTPMDERNQEVIDKAKSEIRNSGFTSNGQIAFPAFESRDAETYTADEIATVVKHNLEADPRANLVLSKVGAQWLTDLTANEVILPNFDGNNVFWADDKAEVSASKQGRGAINDVSLKPKRLTAYIDVSRSFLNWDEVNANEVIYNDLVNAVYDKLESTVLGNVAGDITRPAGLFNGAEEVAALDYAAIADLEASLEEKNFADYKYIMSPAIKAKLRTTPTSKSVAAGFIFENGEVAGVPAEVTSNAKGIIVGDFKQLYIGSWKNFDIIIDPYTLATENKIRITVNAWYDAVMRRPSAFVAKVMA